LSNNVFITRV